MKEQKLDPVEVLAKYFLETKDISLKGKSLYLGNLRVTNLISDVIKDEDLLDELGIFRFVKGASFVPRDFNISVSDYIKSVLNKELAEEAFSILDDDGCNVDHNMFKVYKDIEINSVKVDEDKFLVLRSDHSIVKDVAMSTYKYLITEEVYNKIKSKFPLAYRKYNPYKINEVLQDKKWMEYSDSFQTDMPFINTCNHPKWRYNRDLSARITEKEKKFIESCFLNNEDLQYYINAAYHTIVDKMWSYVMLYGIKGTGKTKLIEMLIPCVGNDNYRKAPQNALEKEFNGYKKDKRLVLMDEMVANTDKAINILKSDANKEFNVEEKRQVSESVKNFVSLWIATNNVSDWKFTHDERRFSVLELVRDTTQERGFSFEWMQAFSERIETEEWANAFFNYLEENKTEDFDTMSPYKTDAFWKVVYESLKPWQMKIADEVVVGKPSKPVRISRLFDERDNYQPGTHKTIIDFLDNYRHEGKTPLGQYIRGKSVRGSTIIPNELFRSDDYFNEEEENSEEISNEIDDLL